MLLVLVLSLFCGVSRTHCRFVLAVLRFVVRSVTEHHSDSLKVNSLMDQIPQDPRTLFNHFDLHPRLQAYICCPDCYALYNNDASAPQTCTYQDPPEATPCGSALFATRTIRGKDFRRPLRLYVAQSLKEWVGRLLSRESVESHLKVSISLADRPQNMRDFWDGEAIRSFLGPDGLPFLDCPDEELRLVFSLSMDGFSPFGKANKAVTVTAIYMACMNLPIDTRYLLENIFLAGILPGPHKPSLQQINPALHRLVQQLVDFWNPGFFFSRTALYPEGRLAKAAVLLLVADILAARQMGGFTAITSSNFCSCCKLQSKDVENFSVETWEPRNSATHFQHAQKWRNATTIRDREDCFKENPVRWSELLDLPYWRAIEYTTLDSMHAHWINSLSHHLDDAWGIDPEAISTEGLLPPVTSTRTSKRPDRPDNLDLRQGLEIVFQSFENNLDEDEQVTWLQKNTKFKPSVLFHLLADHDIRRAGTKYMQAAQLVKWVNHHVFHYCTVSNDFLWSA